MTSIWAGNKVRLRGIEPEDWQAFVRFDEDSANVGHVDRLHPPRSAEGYRHWGAHRATQTTPTDEFQLAIETLADGVLVGSLSTAHADPHAGRFSYGIGIGRKHHRRGYASDAISILLGFMFGERHYHKCEVGIYAFNRASLALHHKLGFQEDSRLREHEFFIRSHHDLVVLRMTVDEYIRRHAYSPV